MRLIFNISLENRSSLCFSLLALHFTAFVAFLQVTGPCSRCQMVCVDQHTAQRSSEPLKTLIAQRGNKVPSWTQVANAKYCKLGYEGVERKIEESKKAVSYRKLNGGYFAWFATALPLSYKHQTPHSLYSTTGISSQRRILLVGSEVKGQDIGS